MKLKYIIGNDVNHHVLVDLNAVTKIAVLKYVKSGITQLTRTESFAAVMDVEPATNPQVRIAKRGFIWDVHLFKVNSNGDETRVTAGLTLPEDLAATSLEVLNDGTTDLTMKDYITHGLTVYTSVLTVAERFFDTADGLTGVSGNGSTVPVVNGGFLELGNEADVHVSLPAPINLSDTSFSVTVTIKSFGANDVTANDAIIIGLGASGDHRLHIRKDEGIRYVSGDTDVPLVPWEFVTEPMTLSLIIEETARLFVNNATIVDLPSFVKTGSIDAIVLRSLCDETQTSKIDYLLVQKMKLS